MPKFNQTWTVGAHEPLRQLADNLWIVDASLPDMPLGRRMTVVRREDGSLIVHNGIALRDEEMARLDALGPVKLICVPNGFHRLDAFVFKQRYPEAQVTCPKGAKKKVEEVVAVDLTYDEVPADGAVRFEHFDGAKKGEGPLVVSSADGKTLIVNDTIFNLPHMSGLFGFIYGRLLGNAGGPRVTSITRLFLLKQKKDFKAHLLRLADEGIKRLIMSHGEVVPDDASAVLRQVAETL